MSVLTEPRRLATSVSWLGSTLLNSLLPPQCLKCGALTAADAALCGACWKGMTFIAAPLCVRCGIPFEFATESGDAGSVCGACLRRPPVWERARAAFRYDDGSRALVLGFKHADKTRGARAFARWMGAAAGDLLGEADLIVPVPLHRRRLFGRRYNQAALLGRALTQLASKPFAPMAVTRIRATPSQGRLSARQRRLNMRGAFAVRDRARPAIEGRRVLLVDDVLTTGATAEAVARALIRGGATAVDVLTLARVVRPVA